MKQKGFTLVELLLYVSLIGVVVMAAMALLSVLQGQRVRSQVILEVESQGEAAMRTITQTVRNATGINSPGEGVSASSLSVSVPSGALSPTVFDLSSGVLRITEGAGSAVSLTNSRVTVSSLTFDNLSRSGTPGTVRISFVLSYNATVGNEYSYSKTFISSATIR